MRFLGAGGKMGFGGGIRSWTPIQLSSLQGWYKADSITGLSNNDPVSTWNDSSGLGRNMVEGSTTRPTYKTAIQNGLPVVDFGGSNWIGTATGSRADWTFLHDDTGATVFVVYQTRADTRYGLIGTNPFSSNYIGWLLAGNFPGQSKLLNVISTVKNYSATNTQTGSTAIINTTHIAVARSNPSASASQRSYLYLNGTFIGNNNIRTATFSSEIPTRSLRLGLNGESGMVYLDGFIGEVVICNTELVTADRQLVEGYLAHKWGLTSKLPSNHPYKTDPP